MRRLPKFCIGLLDGIINTKTHPDAVRAINERRQAVKPFNLSIRHSETVFTPETIEKAERNYDLFVVGSDQVWYPDVFCPALSLPFGRNKKKFSYAASIVSNSIPKNKENYYRNSLQGYSALSERERRAKDILSDLGIKDIEVVLDPVFLIDARMNASDNANVLRHEIVEAKEDLEKMIQKKVEIICWCGGEEHTYTKTASDIIRTAGFNYGFMTNSMPVVEGCGRFQLDRTNIEAEWLMSLVRFQLNGVIDKRLEKKRNRIHKLTM